MCVIIGGGDWFMDKKVGKRVEGVQKFPRRLRGLLLLLVSLIIFNSFTVSVYASDYSLEFVVCAVTAKTSQFPSGIIYDVPVNENFDGNIITWPDADFTTSQVDGIDFQLILTGSFSSGDIVTFNYSSNLGGLAFNTADLRVTENGNKTNFYLNNSSGTFSYTFSENCNRLRLWFTSEDLRKSPESVTPSTRFKLTYSVETEEKGLLKSILDWIKQIPTKIGEFFTNLINNLKEWFNSIGEWFTELGDKISGFFENLFNNIKEFFTSLFKPSDGYFDSVRSDLDAFLSEHLGIVYELPIKLLEQIQTIYNRLNRGSSSSHNLSIAVPAFKFTLFGTTYQIFDGGNFDLYQEGNMPWLDSIINIMHVMIDIALAVGFVRFVYKKIVNKVGIEGGDEI